jgi:hypothetical protein
MSTEEQPQIEQPVTKPASEAGLPISQKALKHFAKMSNKQQDTFINRLIDPNYKGPLFTKATVTKSARAKKRKAERTNKRRARK